MFDNNFSPDEVIGLFNYKHYLIMIVYILLAFILAFLASKLSNGKNVMRSFSSMNTLVKNDEVDTFINQAKFLHEKGRI